MAIQIRARRVVDEDEYDRLEQYDRLVDLFDETGADKDDSEEYEKEYSEEDE